MRDHVTNGERTARSILAAVNRFVGAELATLDAIAIDEPRALGAGEDAQLWAHGGDQHLISELSERARALESEVADGLVARQRLRERLDEREVTLAATAESLRVVRVQAAQPDPRVAVLETQLRDARQRIKDTTAALQGLFGELNTQREHAAQVNAEAIQRVRELESAAQRHQQQTALQVETTARAHETILRISSLHTATLEGLTQMRVQLNGLHAKSELDAREATRLRRLTARAVQIANEAVHSARESLS